MHAAASETGQPYWLLMKGISKSFPGVKALDDVDFEVAPGEVVGLVGENGAGKSTLLKILSGAYRRDAGSIYVAGRPVEIQDPNHARQLGIATIYQEFNLAPNRDVSANVFLGREMRRGGWAGWLGLVDAASMRRRAREVLDGLGVPLDPGAVVGRLSVAYRQFVEIARALAFESRLVVMDEPTASLGQEDVRRLMDVIRALAARGIGVVFVSHRLEEVLAIAHRVVVLRDGRRVGQMAARDATVEALVRLMVGREVEERGAGRRSTVGEATGVAPQPAKSAPLLEVRALSRAGVVENVSFTLRGGEILGVAGLMGAGRTEMVRLLAGADRPTGGEIRLEGRPLAIRSPADAIRAGIMLVPEDRQNQGLILKLPVLENIALPSLDRLSRARGFVVNRRALARMAETQVQRLRIRTSGLSQKTMFLSGGNQQKVVLARWLAQEPKVLILDEPTRGIDVGTKAEVHELIRALARRGIGVIMVSSELPEILALSDRVLVMHRGRVAGLLDRAEATQERIMWMATGHRAVAAGRV
ncbi:MAG: sugar ABC transporter ATP-binding protein [Limnochordaceae bacterium]|nr:sugar ABC transporter ATP-binding protein [Limnochordaceae bacterium]